MKIIYPPDTTWMDYPDNHSQALLVYTIGCNHNCSECHNPELQKVDYSENVIEISDSKTLYEIIKESSKKERTNKIVFSGGDPIHYNNLEVIRDFLLTKKDFDICLYTGHNVKKVKEIGIKNFSFLKCGKYKKNKKQKSEKTDEKISFSSSNQKLYNSKFELISNFGVYIFKKGQ